MQDENVHLKNRLTEILKERIEESVLEKIESFHGRLIKEDEVIQLLRNEMCELTKFCPDNTTGENEIEVKGIINRVRTIWRMSDAVQKRLNDLKNELNDYLFECTLQ